MSDSYDVLIVGGPAGLSAALALTRPLRPHGRHPRRRPGSLDLAPGQPQLPRLPRRRLRQLGELGRQQLADYPQVECIDHKVESIRREGDGFLASGQAGEWRGRSVIIATGVVDHYPHFDGWDEYVGRSMFWCVTCDGYTSRGKRVVVAGNTDDTAVEALQLGRFACSITLLTNSRDDQLGEPYRTRLRDAGIDLVHDRVGSVEGRDREFTALDQLYAAQDSTAQSELGAQLVVATDENGCIIVDREQKTNVAGVFAAGDVTRRYDQLIAAAVHEGAEAAAAANYFLYPLELQSA